MEEKMLEESEFGKGLCYCLGLFLAHHERKVFDNDFSMWFNGAADHLFELEIPEKYPTEIKTRLTFFQDQCLGWRLRPCSAENKVWAINEAKALLLQIDILNGVNAIKGDWE
jgi:hypothetical protein